MHVYIVYEIADLLETRLVHIDEITHLSHWKLYIRIITLFVDCFSHKNSSEV